MPKRITRTQRERQSIFMSGFNTGSNAIIFGLQLTQLRLNTGKTVEEISKDTGLSEKHLKGLEAGHFKDFMMLDTDKISLLAKYFDVAASINFKSQDTDQEPVANQINVPTFEQEYRG